MYIHNIYKWDAYIYAHLPWYIFTIGKCTMPAYTQRKPQSGFCRDLRVLRSTGNPKVVSRYRGIYFVLRRAPQISALYRALVSQTSIREFLPSTDRSLPTKIYRLVYDDSRDIAIAPRDSKLGRSRYNY